MASVIRFISTSCAARVSVHRKAEGISIGIIRRWTGTVRTGGLSNGGGRRTCSVSGAISRRPARQWTPTTAEDSASTDQYLDSFVIESGGEPVGTIEDGDAVVFFNFRGDRAIEISRAFEEEDFREFDRVRVPDVFYAGMMQYDGDAQIPKQFLVEPPAIDSHRVAVPLRRGRHLVRDLGDPEVRARHVLLEREQLRLHRRAPGEVRRDPVRQGAVRRAAVDEGGGDHRRGDRGRPVGRVQVHPAELPERRHGGPHGHRPAPSGSRSKPWTSASSACCRSSAPRAACWW